MGLPTVVFLHAFPLNASMWHAQMAAVGKAGFPVLALDFPGFGAAISSGQRTVQEFAQYITDALERERVKDAVLVGLSMGGYVAFRLMERHPTLVRGLVLADTKASPDGSDARTKRLKMAARVESEGTGFLQTELIPNLLAKTVSAELLLRVQTLAGDAPQSAVYNALAALASRPDSRVMLSEITVPTLILVGEEDAVTPIGDSEMMLGGIRTARLEVIRGAGHLSNLEQPQSFNAALLEFLEQFRDEATKLK
jgi:3-oxoadipate enol-lactonase